MACRVAPRELIECRLAAAIDLVKVVGVVGDAALTRGHDTDQAIGCDQVTAGFDHAHRTECIRHQDARIFLGRNIAGLRRSRDWARRQLAGP